MQSKGALVRRMQVVMRDELCESEWPLMAAFRKGRRRQATLREARTDDERAGYRAARRRRAGKRQPKRGALSKAFAQVKGGTS